jgi:hypothetical protein
MGSSLSGKGPSCTISAGSIRNRTINQRGKGTATEKEKEKTRQASPVANNHQEKVQSQTSKIDKGLIGPQATKSNDDRNSRREKIHVAEKY